MTDPPSDAAAPAPDAAGNRRPLTGVAIPVLVTGTLAGVALAIHQLFNLRAFDIVLLEGRYLYLLAGIFLALAFLVFRGTPVAWERAKVGNVPAWDWALAALSLAASGYFAWTADTSLELGWEFAAPEPAQWASLVMWLLILEAARRAGGPVVFAVAAVFSLYPTVADQMPGPISGFAQPFWDTIPYHLLSAESAFGIPMKAFGNLVIGFILFGALLQFTGGGVFFTNLALSLVGGFRGGAGKVAIFASGFMGSMSGSVISNVLTTGAVSIPAMKRTGFSPRFSGAAEACASTGGVLMPPIMGATAFVMASFLSRPYIEIALAAAIPSLLYYFGLFTQIDAYAAKHGLKGLAPREVPRLSATLRQGWMYVAVFAVLIVLMVWWRWDTLAPFYASALLLVINQALPGHRLDWHRLVGAVVQVGRVLAELVAVLLGIGLIVGAFSATGLAGTLVNDLVFLAGGSTIMLLIMGAVTAFVFGMGMTVTACYVFLAVVLAPALEQAGLDRLAVHLFILYWGMVSFITPPVALGAFSAATLARAGPMETGLMAMRLGLVIYIVPFFFVLNPALIGQGPAWEVATAVLTALVGIWLISGAAQGHLSLVGDIHSGAGGVAQRVLLVLAGLCLAVPGAEGLWGLGHWAPTLAGLAAAAWPVWSMGRTADGGRPGGLQDQDHAG